MYMTMREFFDRFTVPSERDELMEALAESDEPIELDYECLHDSSDNAMFWCDTDLTVTHYVECALFDDVDILDSTVRVYWAFDDGIEEDFDSLEEAEDAYHDYLDMMNE